MEFRPADDELLERTEELLVGRFEDPSSDISMALATFDMGFEIMNRRAALSVVERELAELGRIEIVEVHDLEISARTDGARIGFADVRLFADVHMTALELRPLDHDKSEWVTTFSGTVSGGNIDLRLQVEFDLDWNIAALSADGAARIDFDVGSRSARR